MIRCLTGFHLMIAEVVLLLRNIPTPLSAGRCVRSKKNFNAVTAKLSLSCPAHFADTRDFHSISLYLSQHLGHAATLV